jgi:ADP-ribosyl-[dinitrogen reductase] hydrolase
MSIENLSPSQSASFGAVIGALVGDAAGGVLELLGHRPTRHDIDHAMTFPGGGVFDLAPGQFTDDGEMTVTLVNALVENGGQYELEAVAKSYSEWADSKPFDIGIATSSALKYVDQSPGKISHSILRNAALTNSESKANGSLMRATPLGIVACAFDENRAIEIAMSDSRLTHPHIVCQQATAAYTLAIRHLILYPKDQNGALASVRYYLEKTQSEVFDWFEDAMSGELPDGKPNMGFVKIGFTHAFFHLKEKSGFRSSITQTLALGGDTDTNACIVGGLIGAYYGFDKLIGNDANRIAIYKVLDCDVQSGQPRPSKYTSKNLVNQLSALVSKAPFV